MKKLRGQTFQFLGRLYALLRPYMFDFARKLRLGVGHLNTALGQAEV